MREEFYETSVGPERERQEKMLYSALTVFFAILVVVFVITLCIWSFTGDTGFVVIMAMTLIFGVVTSLFKRRLYLFYDYTYISGEVRIIKVLNGKTRRRVAVFDVKDVFQLGKVGSNSFNEVCSKREIKKIIATPNGINATNQLYYIYVNIDGNQSVIILECDEKLLSYIVSTRGKSIIEKDYK